MNCVKGNNCQHVDLENPVHGTALTSSVVMKWNARAKYMLCFAQGILIQR